MKLPPTSHRLFRPIIPPDPDFCVVLSISFDFLYLGNVRRFLRILLTHKDSISHCIKQKFTALSSVENHFRRIFSLHFTSLIEYFVVQNYTNRLVEDHLLSKNILANNNTMQKQPDKNMQRQITESSHEKATWKRLLTLHFRNGEIYCLNSLSSKTFFRTAPDQAEPETESTKVLGKPKEKITVLTKTPQYFLGMTSTALEHDPDSSYLDMFKTKAALSLNQSNY